MCRAKIRKREKKTTTYTHFAAYNVESKVHGHNVLRHFLTLLSMLSDLYPAYHLTNPCTRSIRKGTFAIMAYFFKMGPSKFLMSFSWIWRRLFLVFISYKLKLALLFWGFCLDC